MEGEFFTDLFSKKILTNFLKSQSIAGGKRTEFDDHGRKVTEDGGFVDVGKDGAEEGRNAG